MKTKSIINILGSLSLAFMLAMSPAAALSNVYAAPEQTQTESEDKTSEETKAEETKAEETKAEETKTEETKTEETSETAASEGETKETSSENTEDATETKTEAVTEEKAAEQPELTIEEQAEKEAEEARKNLQNDPNHVHSFKWIARMGESESAEGTMNYICEECGKIWFFRPISPYVAFEGDVAHRIEKAAEGETLKVKTSHFINFNAQVMKALALRPDVSLYVSFLDQEYKGNRVSFTIPAGEDALSLLDENGYAGFRFLGDKYGLTMEEPMVTETSEEVKEEASEEAEEVQKEAEEVQEKAQEVQEKAEEVQEEVQEEQEKAQEAQKEVQDKAEEERSEKTE